MKWQKEVFVDVSLESKSKVLIVKLREFNFVIPSGSTAKQSLPPCICTAFFQHKYEVV